MKILHIVDNFGRAAYGLGTISLGLAKAQLDMGEDVYLWSSSSEADVIWASENYNIAIERLKGFSSILPPFNISFKEYSASRNVNFDIVHQHSLWTFQSIMTSILRNKGAKTSIAAHGTLSEFALNKSKLKKNIALSLFEKRNLEKSQVLHATSELEIEDFRRLNLKNPIAYIENGIGSQFIYKKGDGNLFKRKYNIPEDKKVLLYLSRITPKKGLDMLLKAISEVKDKFSEWILIIVGNDEFNYQKRVEEMIKELQLSNFIFIVEPQIGLNKFNAFDASNFFILPSYSEGSPMVVVDALAYGLPVITTKSSSWRDLVNYECGYWVDINKNAIKEALLKMLALKNDTLLKYSDNAKKLVVDKYLWDEISKKTISLYSWMINKDLKPDFIY
ncbi:glycosyltransferase [uncultured Chryseobacterium sp.]|uniref:glycosyltransferase n=1 Tax=uncultured Chryseobacterium sp. TaxID=259322 RepID=UPI0025DE3529|nr:glycosyltransferase [uncultured Chryseobacterium sp.]